MAAKRYKLRTVEPKSKDGAAGWLLTFDPVRGEGTPVLIHLTDEEYQEAVVRFPLERLAEEVHRLRGPEDEPWS